MFLVLALLRWNISVMSMLVMHARLHFVCLAPFLYQLVLAVQVDTLVLVHDKLAHLRSFLYILS